jgi:sigma-B regulation protein RsbU (phosphoserine phosphatase)
MNNRLLRPAILVVDDEPSNIRILQIQLRARGYTVVTATNGQEALERVKTDEPDLILLDIMMPHMDGFEVCRRVRANAATQFVPIVMVTALSDTQDRIRAIEAGADDFISKPFDSHEVLARVRSLVRIKQYHDALETANKELAAHNARLEEELQMAREVQEILMPQGVITLPGFQIVSHYTPEKAVGGDFFDLWEIEAGRLGVFISDVMGHDLSSAFITVFIKTIVEDLRTRTDEPRRILETLNVRFNKLISSQLFMFATAFCGVIDLPNETISYANAGHPFPFLIRRPSNTCEFLGSQPAGKGLGLVLDAAYDMFRRAFGPSDGLFLYTDGAYEVQNSSGEELSLRRLQNIVSQQAAQSPGILVQNVLKAIAQFGNGAPRADDITIVAIDADSNAELRTSRTRDSEKVGK